MMNSLSFINNVAHSGNYGWIVTGYGSDCISVSGFRGYLLQEGLVTTATLSGKSDSTGASLIASDLLFTDNQNSLTLYAGYMGS
jgi:hypothetical protein